MHKAESTTMLCEPSEAENLLAASAAAIRKSASTDKSLSEDNEHEFSNMVCDDHQVILGQEIHHQT